MNYTFNEKYLIVFNKYSGQKKTIFTNILKYDKIEEYKK